MFEPAFRWLFRFPDWADYTGKVLAVADGDSITVRRAEKRGRVHLKCQWTHY